MKDQMTLPKIGEKSVWSRPAYASVDAPEAPRREFSRRPSLPPVRDYVARLRASLTELGSAPAVGETMKLMGKFRFLACLTLGCLGCVEPQPLVPTETREEIERREFVQREERDFVQQEKAGIETAKKKGDPIYILTLRSGVATFGGVRVSIDFVNTSSRTIKYLLADVSFVNRVGDLVADELSRRPSSQLKFTGPIDPGNGEGNVFYPVIYNSSVACVKLDKVKIIWMDKSPDTTIPGEAIQMNHYRYDVHIGREYNGLEQCKERIY